MDWNLSNWSSGSSPFELDFVPTDSNESSAILQFMNNSVRNTTSVRNLGHAASSQHQRKCEQLVSLSVNSIVAGLLCLSGFIGNTLSFAVLSKDKSTSPVASFLLESLAFADNFFLTMWFVHFSLNDFFVYFGFERYFHISYYYIRVYTYPLTFMGQSATIWMTVVIAGSRYVAVCIPYRASVYCNLAITHRLVLGVALFSVLYNVPRFFETEISTSTSKKNVTRYWLSRTPFGHNNLYQIVYFDTLYYIFSFVLPLILLSGFNARLIASYRAVQRKRLAMRLRSSRRANETQEQNITLVMIVVILVFMLCNAPARVVQLIWQYNQQKCPTFQFFLIQVSNVLEVFSSSVNFLIYCAFRKQFRQILREGMAGHCGFGPPSDGHADRTINETCLSETESLATPALARQGERREEHQLQQAEF